MVNVMKSGIKGFTPAKNKGRTSGSEECRLTRQIQDIEESLQKFETAVDGLKKQISYIETWKEELSAKLECCRQKLLEKSKIAPVGTSTYSSPVKKERIEENYQVLSSSQQALTMRIAKKSGSAVLSSPIVTPTNHDRNSSTPHNGSSSAWNNPNNSLNSPHSSITFPRTRTSSEISKGMLLAALEKLKTVEERRTPTGVPTVTFLCSYCSHSFNQKGNAQRHVCKTHFRHDMTCQHCKIIYYDEILIVNPICPTCSVENKETNSNRHYRLNGAAKTSHGSRKDTFRKRSLQDESDSDGDCVIERDFNEDSLGFKSEEPTGPAIFIAGTSASKCLAVEKRKDRQNARLRAPTHEAIKLSTETTPANTNLIKLKSSAPVVRSGSNTIAMKDGETISNVGFASHSEVDDSLNISQASTCKDDPVQSEPLSENEKRLSSVAERSPLVEISKSVGSTANTIEKDPVSFTTVQAACKSNGVQNKSSSVEDINIVVRNKYPNFDLKRTLSVSVALKRVSVTQSHLNNGIKGKTVEDTPLKPNQDKPKRIIKKPKLSEFLTGDEVDIVNVRATTVRQGNKPKSPQKQKSTCPTKSAAATRRKVNSKGLSGGQGLIVPETLTLSFDPITTPVKDSPLRQQQLPGSTPKKAKSKQIGPRPGTAHSPDITSLGTTSNMFVRTGGKKKPGRPRKIFVAKLTLTDVPQSQPVVNQDLPPAHAGDADCSLIPESSEPVTDPSILETFKDSSITKTLPQPTETANGIADYSAAEVAVEIPTTSVGEFDCPRCDQRFESNAEAKMHQLVNHDGSSTETIHLGFADVHENYLPLEPVTESSGLLTMAASSEPLITTSSKPEQERTLQSIYSSPFKISSSCNAVLRADSNSLTESSNILVPCISTLISSNTDGGIPLIRNYEHLESSDPGNTTHNANKEGSIGNSTASSIPAISATPTSALESSVTSFSSLSDIGPNLGSRVEIGDRSSLMSTELQTEMTGPSIPLPLAASLNSFGSGSSLHFANTVHNTMESSMDVNRYQEVAPMTSGAVAVPVVIDATCEEPYNANRFITYATGEAEESRFSPDFEVEMEEKVLVMPRDPNFVVWEGFCPDTSFSETRSLGIMRLGRDGIEKLPHNTQSMENS